MYDEGGNCFGSSESRGMKYRRAACRASRVCRVVLFDKLDTAKMHGLDTSNVSSLDMTSQVEFGLKLSL